MVTVRENLMFGLNGHAPANKLEIANRYADIVLKGFEESYPYRVAGRRRATRGACSCAFVVKTRRSRAWTSPFSARRAHRFSGGGGTSRCASSRRSGTR